MRKLSNFLDSYMEYAHDSFCPEQFHYWTGLSILAAALERKVWAKQGKNVHYPNLYVLLVSHPSVGKSTAINRGIELIETMRLNFNPDFKIIPNQATEAALIELMKITRSFEFNGQSVFHSSGYFYADEASSSALKNEHGNFNATLTSFYDCPRVFRKKLKSDAATTDIINIGFNVLAGSTFDFLKTLVNEQTVMGGLASRFVYSICKERIIRKPMWDEDIKQNDSLKAALVKDLAEINKLSGQFKVTESFKEAWQHDQPKFDEKLTNLDSSRLESILARKPTNTMKVCMLLSVSEGNSLELTEKHWVKACEIVDEVTKDNAYILSSAIISRFDTQAGINQLILQSIKRYGGKMAVKELRKILLRQGSDLGRYDYTIKFLVESGSLKLEAGMIELLIDPDFCL